MQAISISAVLQVIISLGLLNVWLLRAGSETAYRGGDAKTLKSEFSAYGLPAWSFYVVGMLKVSAAVALALGVWLSFLTPPASALIAALMLGAAAMHVRVGDAFSKAVPAVLMFCMSATVFLLN